MYVLMVVHTLYIWLHLSVHVCNDDCCNCQGSPGISWPLDWWTCCWVRWYSSGRFSTCSSSMGCWSRESLASSARGNGNFLYYHRDVLWYFIGCCSVRSPWAAHILLIQNSYELALNSYELIWVLHEFIWTYMNSVWIHMNLYEFCMNSYEHIWTPYQFVKACINFVWNFLTISYWVVNLVAWESTAVH